ncbi:peptidase U32 [Paenibacillus agaridevorans]|uniref:Peptidase U32 n=1 Tax=Paenibacillus agaridevorans TaxID=171404 RepID=A0A2R5ERB7_9BACL|nr:peptidase U32 family protein [Paenibacillus agaridevorans]GBG08675.1 peptidase U32 [Paenibacillus agaridevorans]
MTYKPELLATASSMEELELLIDAGADAFVIGEGKYGMRLAGEFTLDMIGEAVKSAKPKGVRIYVSMNTLIDNDTLETMPDYIRGIYSLGIDGIVFGDPAVLVAARELAPGLPLYWNAEMTSTNIVTAQYWARRGATRYVLARELNMEQIEDTKAKSSLEIQVQVHGMTNIYHSKRSLVNSYLDYHDDRERLDSVERERGLYLTEAERPGERYPIYEDDGGTHIMSSDDICMLENLHELLNAGVDSLKIEGMMKSMAYNAVVVRAYRQAIDAYVADPEGYSFQEEWLDAILEAQDPNRELSYGFFYKEQVY